MRARRRLPVIAGMALSAVVMAAPAAHADDFLSPRQDCSKSYYPSPESGGLAGQLIEVLGDNTGALTQTLTSTVTSTTTSNGTSIRYPDRVMGDKIDVEVEDSFNCSNFFNRSFNVDDEDKKYYNHNEYDHRDHGDRDHRDHGDRDHGDRDHGDRDHGDRDHGDRDHRDHGDRDHRGYGRTAPTAATAATAPTAPTAPTARVAR